MAADPRSGAVDRTLRDALRRLRGAFGGASDVAAAGELPEAPPVTVVGCVRASTGMGEVTRATIAALRAVGHPTSWIDVEPIPTLEAVDLPVPQAPPAGPRANLWFVNAVNVEGTRVRLASEFHAGRPNVGCWSWEMPSFPAKWRRAFDPFEEIWVGSGYMQASIAAASPVPVVRLPNLVRPATPSARTRADFGLPPDRFVFLFTFDPCSVMERKNPLAVVRAFHAAFEGTDPARRPVLVLKMNNRDIAERRPALHGLDADTIPALAAAVAEAGGVLLDQRFDRATTSALVACCDAFVSLHRSEGFGLSIAEAMALGKPCIATGWSGNMEFMTPSNSYPVGFRLVTLERDFGPYAAGERWADPDVQDAARWMRHVVDRPDEARRRAETAAADIAREHGPEVAGGAIVARLRLLEHGRLARGLLGLGPAAGWLRARIRRRLGRRGD